MMGDITMKSTKIKTMAYTAAFAAMICITTAYILHIPVGNGYIHIGDGIIYLAASILPFPFGLAAGAIGGGLADLLSGYLPYVIPTMIIKSLNASCFYIGSKGSKLFTKKAVMMSVISGCVTTVGYYIVSIILYGNPVAQIATLIPNVIQAVGSSVLFCILALALDKVRFKERLFN